MFDDIAGAFSDEDRITIQRAVLKTSRIPGNLLEVGNWDGRSALPTIAVMATGKKLVCVDINQTNLRASLELYRVGGFAEIHTMDFRDFYKANPRRVWSHVFIDHDHRYESNVEAIEAFWPQLSPGGIMSFHDVGHVDYPGVKQAVEEFKRKHRPIAYIEGFTSCYRKR